MTSEAEEWGEQNERRFIELANKITRTRPYWLIRVERTDPVWDAKGVDAFAHLIFEGDAFVGRVPIQIKSSRKEIQKFQYQHSGLWKAGIVMLVVHPNKLDPVLQEELYQKLRRVRDSQDRFEPLLERLECITLDGESLRRIEQIQEHRRFAAADK